MEYCALIGLPHSKFLGWSPEDQDKALAWKVWRSSKCPRCGTDPGEWLDEGGYPVEPIPYVVTTVKCEGCAMLHDEREQIPSESRDSITAHLIRNKG